MKYKKTYSKNGLIEWVGIIHAGNMKMEVKFSGGSQTAYGVNPACFTTEDVFTQKFIENSDEFRNGTIRVLRSDIIEGSDVEEPVAFASVPVDDSSDEERVDVPVDADAREVEVADKNEAVEYLKEHCDSSLTATKLRSQVSFDAACAKHHVKFIFTE